jgi:DNA-binding FadR family transcriptional regulator
MQDSPFKPIPSKRIFEQVSDQVRELIHGGVFKPGEKLPPERELANQFNVGRTALREALRVLENEGLIHIKQGSDGGSFINAPNILSSPKSLIDQFRSGEIDPRHLREIRLGLELYMMEFVIQRITDDDIAGLEKSINDAEQSFRKGDVPIAGVSTFHLLIAKASNNPVFEILIGSLMNLGIHILAKGGNRSEFMSQHFKQHREILEAIRDRNLEKAKKALKNHILNISRNMANALEGEE